MGNKYGLKIKNYSAGAIYEYNIGVRDHYDYTNAMLTNSLFLDFLYKIGINVWKETSTREVICIDFNYGSSSYKEQVSRINKKIKKIGEKDDKKKEELNKVLEIVESKKDLFVKKKVEEIRDEFYVDGVNIEYITKNNRGKITNIENIHYKMLYRTPGKAKNGNCMFISERLFDAARDFLYMGIELPYKNAPIVEIGAYSSLVTSSIVGRIEIDPKNILILKDVDAFFETKIVSIETNEERHCYAKTIEKHKLKNTLFDGQALIDSSIFPVWGNGYILLRHHFCKMAAFKSHIQLFFKDFFGNEYDTAKVIDMFGNEHYAKDIKLITTDNAMKWLKFDVSYDYWCEKVNGNGNLFGIVKTAHESKLGSVQKMSYQMINALDLSIMPNVVKKSKDYVDLLRTDDDAFIQYLKDNENFSNDFEVLVALCEQDPLFVRSEYFRSRKYKILETYVSSIKNGKLVQEADNLVIVGSPYAMLLHSVGEDVNKDDTFSVEEGTIQCYTERFNDGDYLAEFRSPFNSKNNMGYLHNVYHDKFKKYFDLGRQIIAVNMIGTDFQDRNNGSDMDSDSIYTTNQEDIVSYAKYCYDNYPTIVNNIPKEKNNYNNTLLNFSTIDNKLAAANMAIGESSNLAQLALTYTYNFNNQKYIDYVCILSVLAQVAIDNAKRSFDIDLNKEILRIKKDMNIEHNKRPLFFVKILESNAKSSTINLTSEEKGILRKKNGNKINHELLCPMNYLHSIDFGIKRSSESTLKMDQFFVRFELEESRRKSKKVEELIEKYSIDLYGSNIDNKDDDYILLRNDFDQLIEDIRSIYISKNYLGLMSWLIDRAFCITPSVKRNINTKNSSIHKNKSILIKTLYKVNRENLLMCFSKNIEKNII